MIVRLIAGIWLLCLLAWGQQSTLAWKDDVRRCAEAKDWAAAMEIVDREVARTPRDMDVRAWRARVLTWSGRLAEAETEYQNILTATPNDPDIWLGVAAVYSREGRTHEALQTLDRAVELDPKRADIRVARARGLRALGLQDEARVEFSRALALDPMNTEGRAGLASLRGTLRHELRVGVNIDWFNFTASNQGEGLTLISNWTPHWTTAVSADGYRWDGTNAERAGASVTRKSARWGALTVGGAAAHDNGVIPRDEGFFDYDKGFRLRRSTFLHGLELVYGQHWYWYSSARILTVHEAALFYLPRDWTWSVGMTGARSHFSGTGSEWRPSGITRLGFPIAGTEGHQLSGNVFFAVGTENFAQVDQIGEFSSQTYGGGLRFQLTSRQDVTGFGAYQMRSQGHTESSCGLTYGLRF